MGDLKTFSSIIDDISDLFHLLLQVEPEKLRITICLRNAVLCLLTSKGVICFSRSDLEFFELFEFGLIFI